MILVGETHILETVYSSFSRFKPMTGLLILVVQEPYFVVSFMMKLLDEKQTSNSDDRMLSLVFVALIPFSKGS